MLGDDPPSMNDAWNPSQKPKKNVDENISTDSRFDKDRDGGYE